MKKLLIVLCGLLILVGCSSNINNSQPQQEDNPEVNNTTEESDVEKNNSFNSVTDSDEVNENDDEKEDVNHNGINNEHLKAFDEFDILSKKLNLEHYEGIVESDNKGNRIIIFQTEDGKKEYKSIFIKNKKRLKIVHFNDEDNLLYNDVIN